MPAPILMVVEEEAELRDGLAADLRRHFSADYAVLTEQSPVAALTLLERLAATSERVALIFAGHVVAGMSATEFLVAAHGLHPSAKRILRLDRGDYTAASPAVRAMALGHIDYHLLTPWLPSERWLYPLVSEFLADWSKTQPPSFIAMQIVGHQWEPRAHQLRQALTRVAMPYSFHTPDSEVGRRLLAEAGQDGNQLPVLIYRTGQVLVQPSYTEVFELVGIGTRAGSGRYDLAIVGAGPAGLAAAVSAASEGLRTVVIEPEVPGGQAGTSSLIRNYPGFPHGISGDDLAIRTFEQAWLFGADFVFGRSVTGLTGRSSDRVVTVTDGGDVLARAVLLAPGVSWRRLDVPTLEALTGAGVYYGAAGSEVRAMQDQNVFVIGAGNSAGQTAINLAEHAASVTMLVRGDALSASMSEYLIAKINETPNIAVRLRTEVVDGQGRARLETLTVRDRDSSTTEVLDAAGVFVLIGAEPHTAWLGDTVARDDHGFVLTGLDVDGADAGSPRSAASRPSYLETSLPGVFAAGDARHGSVKRVASAVGEGAIAVQLIHRYLSEP